MYKFKGISPLKERYPEELTNPQSWCVGIAHRMHS
jgi:hypothetical protein